MNNRRNFLKRIGQTIAGLAVVPSVVKAKETKTDDPFKPANQGRLPNPKKIDQLIFAIDRAEQKHWAINKVICKPVFLEGIRDELHFPCLSPIYVKGYLLETADDLLGDYVLDCEYVYCVCGDFNNGLKSFS